MPISLDSSGPKIELQLTARDGCLEVRASAPGGEYVSEAALPSEDLLAPLAQTGPYSAAPSALKAVGKALYRCLVVGHGAELVSDVLERGKQLRKPVHFELRFDADQVAVSEYPWEMIADEFGRFLVRDGVVNLTRYITYPQAPPVFAATPSTSPLLRIIAHPRDLPSTSVFDLSLQNVQTLYHATFEELQRMLLLERVSAWGMQFDGHGTFLSDRQCGALAFEQGGSTRWVAAEDLGAVLYNTPIQFVLLLACETARIGDDCVFSGVAPALTLSGVAAVVGMQYPVTDIFANEFVNGFYRALLERNNILEALRFARSVSSQMMWYSPVLYLRHRGTADENEPPEVTYHGRSIDTATPSEVQAGTPFLVRLWIRRPETKPLSQAELHSELCVPESVSVHARETEAEIRFELVESREFRRGEVQVELSSPFCEITPKSKNLFVDEHLDAPPAIFTVCARQTGLMPLIFSVSQDGGLIAEVSHQVRAVEGDSRVSQRIQAASCRVPAQVGVDAEAERTEAPAEPLPEDDLPDWLLDLEERGGPAADAPAEVATEEQLPDWLDEVGEPVVEEEIPDWLLDLEERGGPAAEVIIEQPLPDWPYDWLDEVAGPVEEEEILDRPRMIVVESSTLADSLAPSMQMPAPVAGMPDWLTMLEAEIIGKVEAFKKRLALARFYLDGGRPDAAVKEYDSLIAAPLSQDDVIVALEQAVEDYPEHYGLQRALGDAYARSGQLSRALVAYREALTKLQQG